VELTYPQAKNRLKDINDEIERLDAKADKTETRTLNEEDQKYWDDLIEEARAVHSHIGQLERAAQRQELNRMGVARAAARGGVVAGTDDYDSDPLGEPDSIEEKRFKNPWDTSEVRMGLSPEARGQEFRARALSAVAKMQGASDRNREVATQIIERFDSEDGQLSQMVLAISSPAYLRAFSKLARSQGNRGGLTTEENDAVNRAMSLTDAAGGYLVPFQLDPTLILTSNGSFNQIRQIARTVVATGDVWNGVSAGAVSWSWDAEAAEVSDDSPTFAQPTIPVYKANGFVPISIEAFEDAANVAQDVGQLLAEGKDELEAQTFVTGTGVGQPTGVVTALTGTASVVPSAAADTFAAGDVYAVDGALPTRHRMRASWLANRAIYNLIRRFDTQGGANLWAQLGADVPPDLLGRPAYEAEAMDGTITATFDNLVLIFGNFNRYVIADRIGTQVEFIPHLFGANRRPTGQRGWFAYYRAGADSVQDSAFRMLNVT
jgi:HK97 family phage major capsid protein